MPRRRVVRVGDVVRKFDRWSDKNSKGPPLIITKIERYSYSIVDMETKEEPYPCSILYRWQFEHDAFLTIVARKAASIKRKEAKKSAAEKV